MSHFKNFGVLFLQKFSLGFLIIFIANIPVHLQAADNRLDKIIERGEILIGTREQALPFSVKGEDGKYSGFSVDIARMISAGLSELVGKKIRPKFSTVTAKNRFSQVLSGEVDLVCGLTTVTLEREKKVDFSLPFFVDGTRILVSSGSRQTKLRDLSDKVVGVVENTTTAKIVSQATSGILFRNFPNLETAMSAFQAGEVFGVANIGVTLATKRTELGGTLTMELVPQKYSLTDEVIACILPPDNSQFRDSVNEVLFKSFKGVEEYDGEYSDIYFRWFGVNSEIRFPMTEFHKNLMKSSRIWLE